MLSTRDPPQTYEYVQTESEGLEKDIPCKWKSKESQVAILISDKIDLKIKNIMRQRRTIHNDRSRDQARKT